MVLPDGLDEILKAYGNPFPMASMPEEWARRNITGMPTPPGLLTYLGQKLMVIPVHRKVTALLRIALVDLVRLGYGPVPYQKAYAWEVVGDELGVHTWGIAVHLGVPGEGPGELVAAALVRHGLVWSEADPCHFQLATGYWVE